ncbi:MAG: hypothetical protein ACR2PF_06650 [Rhizobiaceae bacterium]
MEDYTAIKQKDATTAELILQAMREAVFYAQESVGTGVICASPIPVSGGLLGEMLDAEIKAPTNARKRSYSSGDHVAFVLMHALKANKVCK